MVSARRVPGDPAWLRKYLEYVAKFQLQQALVFNLDGEHGPPDTCPLPHPTQHPGRCSGAVPAGWHKAPETWRAGHGLGFHSADSDSESERLPLWSPWSPHPLPGHHQSTNTRRAVGGSASNKGTPSPALCPFHGDLVVPSLICSGQGCVPEREPGAGGAWPSCGVVPICGCWADEGDPQGGRGLSPEFAWLQSERAKLHLHVFLHSSVPPRPEPRSQLRSPPAWPSSCPLPSLSRCLPPSRLASQASQAPSPPQPEPGPLLSPLLASPSQAQGMTTLSGQEGTGSPPLPLPRVLGRSEHSTGVLQGHNPGRGRLELL